MDCTAICRICGSKINCNDDITTLGEHLLKKHPEIDMNYYVMENCGDGLRDVGTKLSRSQKKLSDKLSMFLKRSSTGLKGKQAGGKRSVYKTTVESWRPGASPLKCPKCDATEHPYIRKQRNKVAYNSMGAFFLLGCWPLCFLPMLVSGGASTIVCCRKCGYCFGTYDKKKGQLIPATKDVKIETPDLC